MVKTGQVFYVIMSYLQIALSCSDESCTWRFVPIGNLGNNVFHCFTCDFTLCKTCYLRRAAILTQKEVPFELKRISNLRKYLSDSCTYET